MNVGNNNVGNIPNKYLINSLTNISSCLHIIPQPCRGCYRFGTAFERHVGGFDFVGGHAHYHDVAGTVFKLGQRRHGAQYGGGDDI